MITYRTLGQLGLLLGSAALCTSAFAAKPLLMDGKQTLYQRVLVKPDALIHSETSKEATTKEITPFSVLYVYQRKTIGKQQWMQVGSDIHGTVSGWLKAERTIPWNQGLTVAFKDNVKDADRVMLFKDKSSLKSTLEEKELKQYSSLYKSATSGKRDKNSPVVAVAPADLSNLKESFYLVPILDHEDIYLGHEKATLLNVASVSLKQEAKPEAKPEPVAAPKETLKAGVVFVIDSTLSMGPYIERTREAVRKIQKDLSQTSTNTNLQFGLVAFRDSLAPAPDLGYVAQTFAPLKEGATTADFLNQVDDLSAATVSSLGFSEDAYAGVEQAIEGMNWDGIQARYVILITDAGARKADDPLSSTKLSAEALQQAATAKNIAATVLHLKTPMGVENHAEAQTQYETLSKYPGIGSLYYGVDTGDVGQFGQALDTITGQIKQQVQAAEDKLPKPEPIVVEKPKDSQLSKLQEKIAKIGYALQMQYLKSDQQEEVPEIIDAWIVDRDIKDPSKETLEVRVLLTRDQISELHDVMRQVLDSFEEGIISPRNFFEDLKSVAANLSRDPEQLKSSTGSSNLASMGLMQEYIDDLPYQSATMNISADEWELWSPEQQINFAHKLEEKIAYYRALYEHSNLWTTPGGGEVNGSSVIALPLDMMP